MYDATTDLRAHKDKIKKGDLVLLVSEGSPPAREPKITLSEFREFVSGCNLERGYFIGANIYLIKKYIKVVPDVPTILCVEDHGRGDANYISVRADRIYIGQDAVANGLKNDPLVAKLLNPQ
jgi:hypothetical protein